MIERLALKMFEYQGKIIHQGDLVWVHVEEVTAMQLADLIAEPASGEPAPLDVVLEMSKRQTQITQLQYEFNQLGGYL